MLSTLPDILIGIVVVLVLSASMSTLSSLVLTSSSTMTLDLIKGNIVKHMSEKKQIVTMQVLIVFFIVVSVVLALDPPTFCSVDGNFMGSTGRGHFSAIFIWTLLEAGDKVRCGRSFVCGIGITVSNMLFHYIESPINAGAAAMAAGLIVVPGS